MREQGRMMSFIQSEANKYRFPGIVVSERAFWLWRDLLCEVRGHAKPFDDGLCRCCYRKIAK